MSKFKNVIVIDDDLFTRTMLKSSLELSGWSVVGEAATAPESIRLLRTCEPDIAVVDLDLGEGPTGVDVAHALRKRLPGIGIVMLSTYESPRYLGQNQLPLPEGSIYLVKNSVADAAVLDRALQMSLDPTALVVLSKDTYTSAEAGSSTSADDSLKKAMSKLSDKQIETMRLVAAGHSNAEISRRLWVTEASVEKSIARVIKVLSIKVGKEQNQRIVLAQIYHQITGAVRARRD